MLKKRRAQPRRPRRDSRRALRLLVSFMVPPQATVESMVDNQVELRTAKWLMT
jgi:hypothetical protein